MSWHVGSTFEVPVQKQTRCFKNNKNIQGHLSVGVIFGINAHIQPLPEEEDL